MSNRLNQNYNRRNIAVRGGLLVVGALALTACNEKAQSTTDNENIPTTEPVTEGRIVLIDDIEVDVDNISMPNLYEDRPWADPEKLLPLTKEEKTQNARISITPENQITTDMDPEAIRAQNEQLALEIGRVLESIANAGRNPGERAKAEELGLSWEDYIREYYMDPMFDGLFSVKYDDPRFVGADEALKDFFMEFVDEYETALRIEEWRSNVTMFISTEFVEQQDGLLPTDRRLLINIETMRPAMTKKHDPVIYRGNIIVNVDEGEDGRYDIGIQYLSLERQ